MDNRRPASGAVIPHRDQVGGDLGYEDLSTNHTLVSNQRDNFVAAKELVTYSLRTVLNDLIDAVLLTSPTIQAPASVRRSWVATSLMISSIV